MIPILHHSQIGWRGGRGRSSACPASLRTSSSRSSRGCPTGRCAGSSACPDPGSPSAPTRISARNRPRPCPDSSASAVLKTTGPTPTASLNLSGRGRPLVDPSPPPLEGCVCPPLFMECCSSLLLWKVWRSSPYEPEYVVSNPATQQWIMLPPTEARHLLHFVRLGFDPVVPSCFYVFMFVKSPE